MVRWWWLHCKNFSVFACTNSKDKISICSPLATNYHGKHIKHLVEWMKEQGEFEWEELKQV